MGYRDTFYTADNILGYTGTVHLDPTVYFWDGYRFGRITQDHKFKDNVGRGSVRHYDDYAIGNVRINGELRCVEFYGGGIRHTSRNTLTQFNHASGAQQAVLKRCIYNYPERKPGDSMTRAEKELERHGPPIVGLDEGGVRQLMEVHAEYIAQAAG